jgi:hypothetical protein
MRSKDGHDEAWTGDRTRLALSHKRACVVGNHLNSAVAIRARLGKLDVGISEGSMSDQTFKDAGSTWAVRARHREKDYTGTRLNANNERVPIVIPAEQPTVPKPRCMEHREKVHVLSSGECLRACSHFECAWGKKTAKGFHKKHSDGSTFAPTFEDIPTVVETEDGEGVEVEDSDMPQELSVSGLIDITASELGLPDQEGELEDAGPTDGQEEGGQDADSNTDK